MAKTHTLVVPLDASGVDGFEPGKTVKVLVQDASGPLQSQLVELGEEARAEAVFELAGRPGGLTVAVGPDSATDEELAGLQTITQRVSRRAWGDAERVVLHPIAISSFYWHWWWRWCREFVVRGRVVCPDGSPVPGAKVCAYDVDWLWWWTSRDEVGCHTTDVNGEFELRFKWCCGFWPWYWWLRRDWRLDTLVAGRIQAALRQLPELGPLPVPGPAPDLGVLAQLAGHGPGEAPLRGAVTDPTELEPLRARLAERLETLGAESLRIWPWWPFHPWSDCTPDLLFRVTQDCGQGEQVVLDEGWADTRWNVPQKLSVTLVTSTDACCVHRPPECGDEDCIGFSKVCDDLVADIGGNLGAPATPEGYLSPGLIDAAGDRPYAGVVPVKGVCGEWIDYYEFELSADHGATWAPMPSAAAGDFTLRYFDAATLSFPPVSFSFQAISGHNVIESVGHWESVHGSKPWIDDPTLLMRWLTTTASSPTGPTALFADGTYHLRLKAYQLTGPGELSEGTVPPQCGSDADNVVKITIDNHLVGPASGHPNLPGHHCGGVHVCTTEPDTDFIAVRVNGVAVDACALVDASKGGTLEVDFLAHDPDGHLAKYTLDALWGESNVHSLLALPSAALTMITAGQAGPTYGDARAGLTLENIPPAAAPTWEGGRIRLTVDLAEAFPVTCCYLLDLYAYKRTIDGCNHDLSHYNRSTYTLTVAV